MLTILRLVIFLLFLSHNCWAGNTTICSSGCDYTTLFNWEAGEDGTITAPAVGQITGSFQDTTHVIIDGFTGNSAANYIKVHTSAAARHDGKWNTGKYRLEIADGDGAGIFVKDEYVRIDGLQIRKTGSASQAYKSGIAYASFATTTANELQISNCLIMGILSGNATASGIWINSIYAKAKIWNNIIYDFINGANNCAGIRTYMASANSAWVDAYNNTVHNCYIGYWDDKGDNIFDIHNNIAQDCTDGFRTDGGWEANPDYNISDVSQADADSVNDTFDGYKTVTFVAEGSDNFHLSSSDTAAKDAGVSDPGSGLFSDDIDSDTRSGTWDIGADEYIAAGGGLVTPFGLGLDIFEVIQ